MLLSAFGRRSLASRAGPQIRMPQEAQAKDRPPPFLEEKLLEVGAHPPKKLVYTTEHSSMCEKEKRRGRAVEVLTSSMHPAAGVETLP